ncbi:acyl carrier protein [Paramagnetospirillum magneticum]|uniref:Acyl carrier protein n=1 Tax=Paramagnetospirillum magneticum (strain ATCC 700264 / AMB-1) TaxID=342108 RepID=Q2W6H7_PARM1|nr:acyl carrier protein [Paramagnetospirillum magneticum]BAE50548.1 hypothetical protein amb1744 [Paramagnetospirillum magneticum AMB-1]
MAQHSRTFPACQACASPADLCASCIAAAEARRDEIDAAVLLAVARHVDDGTDIALDRTCTDLGIDGLTRAHIELELEDHFGRPIPLEADWGTLRGLADQIALQLLPGESGEILTLDTVEAGIPQSEGEG